MEQALVRFITWLWFNYEFPVAKYLVSDMFSTLYYSNICVATYAIFICLFQQRRYGHMDFENNITASLFLSGVTYLPSHNWQQV